MQLRHPARACTLLGLVVLALSGPAWAQEDRDALDTLDTLDVRQPRGIREQRWSVAAALFAEGTRLFKQWRFGEAEAKYREALTYGEHRLIRLYLGRALEKQGRLIEAHEALQHALRPGIGPLPPEDVQVARELRASLESRLAQIEARCDVPGAEISLDGEPWFRAPGRQRRIMRAGQHMLVARKPGYFPVTEPISLIPGKQTRVALRMTADVVHIERRWPSWQPPAVAGSGIAMSLIGGMLLRRARSEYASIQMELDACRRARSCEHLPSRRLDGSRWSERIGTGTLIAGGTLLAAGLAGVFLNLPRARRSEPAGTERPEIMPVASRDTAGISVQLRF